MTEKQRKESPQKLSRNGIENVHKLLTKNSLTKEPHSVLSWRMSDHTMYNVQYDVFFSAFWNLQHAFFVREYGRKTKERVELVNISSFAVSAWSLLRGVAWWNRLGWVIGTGGRGNRHRHLRCRLQPAAQFYPCDRHRRVGASALAATPRRRRRRTMTRPEPMRVARSRRPSGAWMRTAYWPLCWPTAADLT